MRVLAAPDSAQGNHYVGLLYGGLSRLGVVVEPFSLRTIMRKCDLCHVHWPDLVVACDSLLVSFWRVFRFFFMLVWCKLIWGGKVVWTVHNLEPHEKTLPLWWRRIFYRVWFSLVDGCIFMSEASHKAFESKYHKRYPYSIVPHGHYCDVCEETENLEDIRQHFHVKAGDVVFGHYGQIRDYKNIPYLMREFSRLKGERYKLIVAGKMRAEDGELLNEIESFVDGDPRIYFKPGFISDQEMADLYGITSCAVLPYKSILNSGSAIHALSFGCPVLVPNIPAMVELREQVNMAGVKLMSSEGLLADLRGYAASPLNRCRKDDLSNLEWPHLAKLTYDFYRELS